MEADKVAEYLDFFNVYIIGIIEAVVQFYFLTKILKKKIGPLFYFLFAVCATIVIDFVPVSTITGFAVLVFLFTVYGIFICRADFKSSLLYAALAIEIMRLSYGVVNSLIVFFSPWMLADFHDSEGIVFMLVSYVVSLLLSGFCYYIVYRCFSMEAFYPVEDFYSTAQMQQLFLVFTPMLMIFIMSRYINLIEYRVQFEVLADEGPAGYLFRHGQMFVMNFLGLVSLFCILFFYKKLQQNFRLSTKLSLLEQEEHSLNQYVEEAKTRYNNTKSFRHDIKNHIAVVKRLLQNGKLDEAINYIEDMDDIAEKMSFPCSTNNLVVDILVGNKLGIAKSMGIRASCSLLLPYPCGLRDIDICIVLSNALDNAIYACKNMNAGTEKYICVSGRTQGDFLMMEIENSFQEKGTFKKGTGLSNIKTVAEKYNGAISIETQENVFVLQVLLIIPQQSEDISQQVKEPFASNSRKKK